jgi:hypothetical protein
MAWHYKQYARDQASDDRGAYARGEVAAWGRTCEFWHVVGAISPCTFLLFQPKIILFGESYALL